MAMMRITICFILLAVMFPGCGNKQQYPATARVELKTVVFGDPGTSTSITVEDLERQKSVIVSNVLKRAANGSVQSITWYGVDESLIEEPPENPTESADTVEPPADNSSAETGEEETGSAGVSSEQLVIHVLDEIIQGKAQKPVERADQDMTVVSARQGFATRMQKGAPLPETEAVDIMRRNLEISADSASNVMEITYYSEDATEAMVVANLIAKAYVSFLEEENVKKINQMISVAETYRNALPETGGEQKIKKLEEELDSIVEKYQLRVGDADEVLAPEEINRRKTEKASLGPELRDLQATYRRLNGMSLDEQAQFFAVEGNAQIDKQRGETARLGVAVREAKIKHGDDSPEAKVAQTDLDAAKASLGKLVAAAIDAKREEVAEKQKALKQLDADIRELEDNYLEGSVQYAKKLEELENEEKSWEAQMETQRRRLAGRFLFGTIISEATLPTATVARKGDLDAKMILIVAGIGLVLTLNVWFIIFMVRSRKRERPRYY